MEWITIYVGCVLTGVIFGGALSAGGSWLYQKLDTENQWSAVRDALTLAGITVGAVLISAAVGAVYGHESADMGNSWKIGAIWGAAGGVLSPWLFRPLRVAGAKGIRAAADKLTNKAGG